MSGNEEKEVWPSGGSIVGSCKVAVAIVDLIEGLKFSRC